MGEGNLRKTFKPKEKRSVSAGININVSKQLILPLKFESDLCRFYVYTDHLFFLNCHCEGAVIKRLSQRLTHTLCYLVHPPQWLFEMCHCAPEQR